MLIITSKISEDVCNRNLEILFGHIYIRNVRVEGKGVEIGAGA